MNQTLILTQEDLCSNRVTLVNIRVEKVITCQQLKIEYSSKTISNKKEQYNVPFDYLIIILNDQVLNDGDKVEQRYLFLFLFLFYSNGEKLLVQDVRKMYEELKLLKMEKINQQEEEIQEYFQIDLQEEEIYDCIGQNFQLELQVKSKKEQYYNTINGLQSEIEQLKSQNEIFSLQIQEQQSQIDSLIQKIQVDGESIEGYNQYINQFNYECYLNYGYYYQQGLVTYFNNQLKLFQSTIQQYIVTIQQENADLEEQIDKNKTEFNKKLRKLNQEKIYLEQELQSAKEVGDKVKKNQNRFMTQINDLKKKLKLTEEELQKQLESKDQSEEQKNQQLKEQNRQLQRKLEDLELQNYQQNQVEKEYQLFQNKLKLKADEADEAEQQIKNSLMQITDERFDLRTCKMQKQYFEQKLNNQQNFQQSQLAQQQQNRQNNSMEENISLTAQIRNLTRKLDESKAIQSESNIVSKYYAKYRYYDLMNENLSLKQQIHKLKIEGLKNISDYKAQQKMNQTKFESLEQQFLISQKKNNQYEATIQKYLQEQNKQNKQNEKSCII